MLVAVGALYLPLRFTIIIVIIIIIVVIVLLIFLSLSFLLFQLLSEFLSKAVYCSYEVS